MSPEAKKVRELEKASYAKIESLKRMSIKVKEEKGRRSAKRDSRKSEKRVKNMEVLLH